MLLPLLLGRPAIPHALVLVMLVAGVLGRLTRDPAIDLAHGQDASLMLLWFVKRLSQARGDRHRLGERAKPGASRGWGRSHGPGSA